MDWNLTVPASSKRLKKAHVQACLRFFSECLNDSENFRQSAAVRWNQYWGLWHQLKPLCLEEVKSMIIFRGANIMLWGSIWWSCAGQLHQIEWPIDDTVYCKKSKICEGGWSFELPRNLKISSFCKEEWDKISPEMFEGLVTTRNVLPLCSTTRVSPPLSISI